MNGAPARRTAARSPVANEPATTQPMCPLGPRSGWDRRPWPWSLGVGSVATMTPVHAQSGAALLARAVNIARLPLPDVISPHDGNGLGLSWNPRRHLHLTDSPARALDEQPCPGSGRETSSTRPSRLASSSRA